MIKQISKLHYITQDHPEFSHIELVQKACESGIDWIQLRAKNRTTQNLAQIAKLCKDICHKFGATFIINDNVELAKELDLDGVHLGLTDLSISEARKILGNDKIIGGTANTLNDVELQTSRGADYVGVGPFRFTSTKENLSPVLGVEGYKQIVNEAKIPVIAIGGITPKDISELVDIGVHGVAVASEISFSDNMKTKIKLFQSNLGVK